MTDLQSSFSINNIALVNGRPQTLNLKQLLEAFVDHRHEVVIRRTRFDLAKAEERAHILEGLIIASDHIDEVVKLIRSSRTREEAKTRLMERFSLSEKQAQAIVDMRLGQLTGLDQDKLRNEYAEVEKMIASYKEILADESVCMKVVKDELLEIKKRSMATNVKQKSFIPRKSSMPRILCRRRNDYHHIAHGIYQTDPSVRIPCSKSRRSREQKGAILEEDFIEYIYPASMHNYIFVLYPKGKCYWLKVYEIPEGAKNSKDEPFRICPI